MTRHFDPFEVEIPTLHDRINDFYEIDDGLVITAAYDHGPTAVIVVNDEKRVLGLDPRAEGEKLADWIYENLPGGTAETVMNRLMQCFAKTREQYGDPSTAY